MRSRYKTALLISVIIIIIITMFSGCGASGSSNEDSQNQSSSNNQSDSSQTEQKPPDSLTGIEKGLETVIRTLNGPAAMLDESQQGGSSDGQGSVQGGGQSGIQSSSQESGQSQSQSNSKQQGSSSSSSGSSGGAGGSGTSGSSSTSDGAGTSSGQNTQTTSEPIAITNWKGVFKVQITNSGWDDLISVINKLQYQWNSLEPEAAQKGAVKELLDQFSNALNSLTDNALGKYIDNCIYMANLAFSFIPDFYSLYQKDNSPEFKRMRYYARNCVLNSLAANWSKAATDLSNLKSLWTAQRGATIKLFSEAGGMLEYSIMELEKVVTEKNQSLSDIKGRIVISNITVIEKLLEKQL